MEQEIREIGRDGCGYDIFQYTVPSLKPPFSYQTMGKLICMCVDKQCLIRCIRALYFSLESTCSADGG